MRVVYDKASELRLPNGRILSVRDMEESATYDCLLSEDMVVDVDSSGTLLSMSRLAPMKDRFGITESDPYRAWELVQQAEEAERKRNEEMAAEEVSDLRALSEEISDIRGALVELASLMEN